MNKRRFFQRNGADGSSGSGDDSEADRADGGVIEYSIDELARAASTTVRNVRAYQDRGLLPPPERRGRVGIYGESHLSRLRIIGQLLARGFTLVSIGELINAWESGSDLGGLLGLESAVSSPGATKNRSGSACRRWLTCSVVPSTRAGWSARPSWA